VDYVRRWRRPIEAGEEKMDGRRSPLDNLLLLINAVFARHPPGAYLIRDRIDSEVARLDQIHGYTQPLSPEELERKYRETARQLTEAADALARTRV